MTRLMGVIAMLLVLPAAAETTTNRFYGYAFDLKSDAYLYTEVHEQVIEDGMSVRAVAATKMNAVSSRSHCIIMMVLIQTTVAGKIVSKLNMVDLAGSEKVGKTEIDLAVEKQPDLVTLWAGNNDILFTALMGSVDDRSLTPIEDRRWLLNPGDAQPEYTERIMPGLESSMVGPNGSLTRLLNETDAEVMLMNIPDVTTIPHLLTVGEKVGRLPFEVVLPDGTDVTKKLEEFRIPVGVYGAEEGKRKTFPEGTRVGLGYLLTTLYRLLASDGSQESFALQSRASLLTEDEVLDPDEVAQVQEHTKKFNAILEQAAKNPRVHLVDVNRALGQARKGGFPLRGVGPDQKVGASFIGVKGDDGMEGLFSYDGVHPSDVGQAVVANLILDVAKEQLADDSRFESVVQAETIDEKAVLKADPRLEAKRPRLVLAEWVPGLLGGFGAR